MEIHPIFGLSAPEKGWVPSPRYLLRRARVLNLFSRFAPGSLLEVGCGAGALLVDLAGAGFKCTALEISPAAQKLVREIHADNGRLEIFSEFQKGWKGAFKYLVALEVLEHIEDDQLTLNLWNTWLQPDGKLVLSVPAHPRRWNPSDVWVGHYRRYERKGLQKLLMEGGFLIEHMECYGFPLANIIEPLRAKHCRRLLERQLQEAGQICDREDQNKISGIERSLEVHLSPLLFSRPGVGFMRLAFFLQNWFSRTDWGNGYLVVARRQS